MRRRRRNGCFETDARDDAPSVTRARAFGEPSHEVPMRRGVRVQGDVFIIQIDCSGTVRRVHCARRRRQRLLADSVERS